MDYQGPIYRPPSEADSILLQVTTGCSHNRCTFCGMYKGQRFSIKSAEQVERDIDFAALHYPHARRLFLCDGDALILPQARLLSILACIRERLPGISRVGIYANCKGLKAKTEEELLALGDLGLGIVYLGLESGDDSTLAAINKGAASAEMIAQAAKVKASGILLSVTVLLGIAGHHRSQIHAEATGRVLSAMDPDFVGALSIILESGTLLAEEVAAGRFSLPEPLDLVRELRTMIKATHLSAGLFHANHASNYLPIRARLPQEKSRTLALLDQALEGRYALKPEYLRGL